VMIDTILVILDGLDEFFVIAYIIKIDKMRAVIVVTANIIILSSKYDCVVPEFMSMNFKQNVNRTVSKIFKLFMFFA